MRSRNIWRILLMVGALALLAATVPIAGAGANGAVIDGTYPLYAGQDIPVGDVTVTNDTENLFVTFAMDADYCMMETHLQVGDLEAVQKNGNPIPGKFEYSMDHDCVDSHMYTVPLGGLTDIVEIAAHADVKAPVDGEMCDVWMIGDVEAPWLDTGLLSNYADEFNWGFPAGPATKGPGLNTETPLFADPFIVGTTPTVEFPYNSNTAKTYATDFNVQWDGHLHFGGTLTVSWSPGQSAFEEKEVTFGTSTATFTETGTPETGQGFFMDVYPLIEDSMSVDSLGFATHMINFQHTAGDGTFWDWILLERPCETYESAWGATDVGKMPFPGKNWATYFTYQIEAVEIVDGVSLGVYPDGGTVEMTLAFTIYDNLDGSYSGVGSYDYGPTSWTMTVADACIDATGQMATVWGTNTANGYGMLSLYNETGTEMGGRAGNAASQAILQPHIDQQCGDAVADPVFPQTGAGYLTFF